MRMFISTTGITLNYIGLRDKNYPGEFLCLLIGWQDECAKPALLRSEINYDQPLT